LAQWNGTSWSCPSSTNINGKVRTLASDSNGIVYAGKIKQNTKPKIENF